MTTMPVEIFSDHIDDDEESPKSNKSLSKMNKTELYQFSKELVKENMRLQLFVNSTDELHKHNENTKLDMSKKIKELEKEISLYKQSLSRDDVEVEELKEKYCTVCLDYDKLAEDHEELKEKVKELEEDNEDYHFKINDLEEASEDYEELKEENEKLKEKDKKSKEIFKELVEWYESCKNDSEEEDEDEDEDEEDGDEEVDFICKGCQRETTDTITERNCSEYLCRECQKYL